jgi:hypothetical protein
MNATDEGNEENLGDVDRFVRVVAGIAMLALCLVGPTSVWGLVGVLPLVTGIAGECPIYRALGISTRRATNRNEETP